MSLCCCTHPISYMGKIILHIKVGILFFLSISLSITLIKPPESEKLPFNRSEEVMLHLVELLNVKSNF